MKNIKKIVMITLILLLATSIAFADTIISGPNIEQPLEIYSNWMPYNFNPVFTLSTDSQSIYYSENSIMYETNDYDLSYPGQTETFYIDVYSNHWSWTKNYNLYIYYSDQFHPTSNQTTYPDVDIYYNSVVNNTKYWKNFKYITLRGGYPKSDSISYNNRIVDATVYKYQIRVLSGLQDIELIRFNFSWNGYSLPVSQYWDMEGYVKIIIESY